MEELIQGSFLLEEVTLEGIDWSIAFKITWLNSVTSSSVDLESIYSGVSFPSKSFICLSIWVKSAFLYRYIFRFTGLTIIWVSP